MGRPYDSYADVFHDGVDQLVLVPGNHRANLHAIERVHYDGTAKMYEEDAHGRCLLVADEALIAEVERAGFVVARYDA